MVSKPTVSHTRNRLFLTDPYTYVLYVRPGEDIDDTYIEKIQLYKSEILPLKICKPSQSLAQNN